MVSMVFISKTKREIQGADDKLGQTLRTHLKQ
jgi:hypothetical protein